MDNQTTLQQAIESHAAGDLSQADQLYRKLLIADPGNPDANHNFGILSLQFGQVERSVAYLHLALAIDPDQGQYWLSYLEALIRLGRIDAAKKVLQTGKQRGLRGNAVDAIEIRLADMEVPGDRDAHDSLNAHTLFEIQWTALLKLIQEGGYQSAASIAEQMTEEDPTNGFAWKAFGTAIRLQGHIERSLYPLQQAAKYLPEDIEVQNNLAVTLIDLKRWSEAESTLLLALRIDPNYPSAHYNLGLVHIGNGQIESALSSFRRAVEIKPDYAEAHNNLGGLLNDLERFADAKEQLLQAIKVEPKYVEALNNLAISLKGLGSLAEAESCSRRAISLRPNNAKANNTLGVVLIALRRNEEALEYLRRAIELNPGYAAAQINLAHTLNNLGKISEAKTHYISAIEAGSGDAESYIHLGALLINSGKLDEARHWYARGLERVSARKEYIAAMDMTACWIQGKYKEAEQLAKQFANQIDVESPNRTHPQKTFFIYVSRLLTHRKRQANTNQPNETEDLVVLGDSHSLTPHRQIFPWLNEKQVSATCRFIYGIKMFHLASSRRKNYPAYLSERIRSVAPNSHLLFTIGEIDCRPNEGLVSAARKENIPLTELLVKTVDGYMEWLSREVMHRRFASITIQGIPAPNYLRADKYGQTDRVTFLEMIRGVNHRLRKLSAARQWNFLDVYSATVNTMGESNEQWHLDSHHLVPDFYLQAQRWMK